MSNRVAQIKQRNRAKTNTVPDYGSMDYQSLRAQAKRRGWTGSQKKADLITFLNDS